MAAAAATVLEAEGLGKRYGEREALRGRVALGLAGRAGRDHRPQRRGQDHAALHPRRDPAPDLGHGQPRSPPTIGWVPQQAALYGKLTVEENLRLFARLERVADPDATVERMLDLTGLRERAGDQVAVLSGGNRQRVNIAIGLLGEQPILLLDEPSAALDPRQRERVWEFVLSLAAERARRSSTPPTTSRRPSATPSGCSCWPTAS